VIRHDPLADSDEQAWRQCATYAASTMTFVAPCCKELIERENLQNIVTTAPRYTHILTALIVPVTT
jgi:hypothetical protein